MSKISKLFKGSSGSSSSRPSPQEAIHKLRETEEMLTKKQDYLEKRIEQEITIAKKNGTKNKRAALQALKRKKRLEQQLTQIDGTLSTIEFQREALENSHTNTEVLKNMGYAAKAMKKVHENMDLDKIDDLMQDITEQQDVAQEISNAISGPFGETFDEVHTFMNSLSLSLPFSFVFSVHSDCSTEAEYKQHLTVCTLCVSGRAAGRAGGAGAAGT
uniref:Charged multivesicular body protein 4C n=1 Tax=Labrus bergylta TaxID=56723 RepID=A0A3Q3MPU9_9LABR